MTGESCVDGCANAGAPDVTDMPRGRMNASGATPGCSSCPSGALGLSAGRSLAMTGRDVDAIIDRVRGSGCRSGDRGAAVDLAKKSGDARWTGDRRPRSGDSVACPLRTGDRARGGASSPDLARRIGDVGVADCARTPALIVARGWKTACGPFGESSIGLAGSRARFIGPFPDDSADVGRSEPNDDATGVE